MKKHFPLLFLGFLFFVPQVHASGYSYYRAITVSSSTAIASGTQSSFPMLVSSTITDWIYPSHHITSLVTAPNGGTEPADLVFATSIANCGVSNLNFETESYSSSTGALVDWVNVPSMAAGTVIYACYGNSSVTADQSHPSSTWNSNYAGVWHLANPTSSVSTYDSKTAVNGTNNGPVASTTGQIDGAGVWGGHTTDAISTDVTSDNTQRTYSVWEYLTGYGGGSVGRIFSHVISGSSDEALYIVNNGSFYYQKEMSGTQGQWIFAAYLSLNTWYYMVVTYDDSNTSNIPKVYVDGNPVTVAIQTSPTGSVSTSSNPYAIGNRLSDSARNWAGKLDEFHIANTIQTPSWILTEYNNQNSPSTFYAVGSEQTAGGGSTPLQMFFEWIMDL